MTGAPSHAELTRLDCGVFHTQSLPACFEGVRLTNGEIESSVSTSCQKWDSPWESRIATLRKHILLSQPTPTKFAQVCTSTFQFKSTAGHGHSFSMDAYHSRSMATCRGSPSTLDRYKLFLERCSTRVFKHVCTELDSNRKNKQHRQTTKTL